MPKGDLAFLARVKLSQLREEGEDRLVHTVDKALVDANGSMIEVLKKKIDKKDYHRVKVQDAVNLNLNNRFDLIIAPFRVFSHLSAM
jgi:ubiquinone/menaquinone biosynthesis C-methylase UbiE